MDEKTLKLRAKVVRSLDDIAHLVNDERVFEYWLLYGVADGDIDDTTTDEELEYYCEDSTFAELLEDFLTLMTKAKRSGGLYCDGITSESNN